MADRLEELAADVMLDYAELSGRRSTFENHWDDIADYLWPNYRNTFSPGYVNTPGERKTEKQLDSAPQIALDRFGAILDSLLTPRSSTWHRVQASNPDLMRDHSVKQYFHEVNRRLFRYRYAPEANFASQNQILFKSLGAFGSGAMFIDSLASGAGVRYRAINIGEQYWRENHQGTVDTILRRFSLKARQAVQVKEWRESLPDDIVEAAGDPRKRDEEFWFIHRVRPRADANAEALDSRALPYESTYVSERHKKVVAEGGYRAFPYAPTRYDQAPNETYGRSPAMQALPAIKTLMAQKRDVLTQGHRAVAPVLLGHDDGIMDAFNIRPGAFNSGAVNADGRPLVHTLPAGDIPLGMEMMQQELATINEAFLVSLFQILVETPDRQTATEVLERAREKGMLLAPTVGRQQSEYLGPLIQREIDVLTSQNLLPPMPQALIEARGDYTVQYDSPLSRMARAEEASGFMRVMETLVPVINVTQDASILDRFDFDTIAVELSDIQAVPATWLHSDERLSNIRQSRAQTAAQQQAAAAAPGQAAIIKAMADAKQKGLKASDLQ